MPFTRATLIAHRRLLREILFPGAVVVDAGANIGIYSQFLSRCVGPTGLVHSFEPSPDNFKRLCAAADKLLNVRLSQAAVGERSGESKLYISEKLNVDHRAYKADGNLFHLIEELPRLEPIGFRRNGVAPLHKEYRRPARISPSHSGR